MPPVVSVVIPVFNGENYLSEAVESVLAQTYADYELIVVDDGSTDSTPEIIRRYEEAHPVTVRGIHQPNGGTASALNNGIRAARGEFVAWLSHDDRFRPGKLAAQMAFLVAHPDLDGVYTDYALIDPSGQETGVVHSVGYPPEKMARHLLQAVFINGSTLLVRKGCLEAAGLFDESVRYAHDALLWVHLAQRSRLGYLAEPLTEYRVHPAQGTQRGRAIRADNRLWLSKALHADLADIFPELRQPGAEARHRAAAYTYLGEVCARRYRQLGLAVEQYRRALHEWPSVGNPALIRIVTGPLRAITGKLRDLLHPQSAQPLAGDIYLRQWADFIPDIDVPGPVNDRQADSERYA